MKECYDCLIRIIKNECNECKKGLCDNCTRIYCNKINKEITNKNECLLHFKGNGCWGIITKCEKCSNKKKKEMKEEISINKIKNAWIKSTWNII